MNSPARVGRPNIDIDAEVMHRYHLTTRLPAPRDRDFEALRRCTALQVVQGTG